MVDVKSITEDRLKKWGDRLVVEHATPVVLVSVGHDHVNGRIVVTTTENMPTEHVIAFLEATLQLLKNG